MTGRRIRPHVNPRVYPGDDTRAGRYQVRIEGLTVAINTAAARDDTATVERLSRVVAALQNCILTGHPFRGWSPAAE